MCGCDEDEDGEEEVAERERRDEVNIQMIWEISPLCQASFAILHIQAM